MRATASQWPAGMPPPLACQSWALLRAWSGALRASVMQSEYCFASATAFACAAAAASPAVGVVVLSAWAGAGSRATMTIATRSPEVCCILIKPGLKVGRQNSTLARSFASCFGHGQKPPVLLRLQLQRRDARRPAGEHGLEHRWNLPQRSQARRTGGTRDRGLG